MGRRGRGVEETEAREMKRGEYILTDEDCETPASGVVGVIVEDTRPGRRKVRVGLKPGLLKKEDGDIFLFGGSEEGGEFGSREGLTVERRDTKWWGRTAGTTIRWRRGRRRA